MKYAGLLIFYYNYYYYKSTDYSDASLKLQGHFTYQIENKRWYSSQKSVVRQLKQMGLCRRKDNSDEAALICAGRAAPRPRRCHRKGAVAKSYTTSLPFPFQRAVIVKFSPRKRNACCDH